MQFSQNTIRVHITAHTDLERGVWATHFARLFVGANSGVSQGLWEGIAEQDVQVETVVFDPDYCTFLAKVFKELETYQQAANQQTVLVEGEVLGQRWAILIENPEDFSLGISRVATLVETLIRQHRYDALEEAAELSAYQDRVALGLD